MFVRVVKSRMKIDKLAAAGRTFRETVFPLCRKQRGFKGGYFLSDPKTGESVAMTFWESEEDMLATEASRFFQDQLARFVPFYAKPPVRESYEVTVRQELGNPKS
jgi:heme-degrading monooxygenase HmoA